MALLCTRYVTITDHLLCGCWYYERESYYTTLRHVVNGVINLANPRSLQPPYMYFVCERPISMAVERWTNLSMSQQPPWTSDFDHLDDLDHIWSPWVLCHLNAVLCETLSPSQAFSEDDVTQQLHARNLKVGWSDGAMEHTSSGFYFRFSLDLAILAYFRILAYSYCTCALPRRGISV